LVERHDRTPVATFFLDAPMGPGDVVQIGAEAAHHARVKRLSAGDRVRLSNGAGLLATGTIAALRSAGIEVAVTQVDHHRPPPPIHLRVPVADRDRMLWLAEKSAEIGITSWQAVRFRRSSSVSPRGEGPAFSAKLRARMIGALEQSGGAWLPALLADADPGGVTVGAGACRILLAVEGPPLLGIAPLAGEAEPVVLFGPEGGIEPDEMALLSRSGWRPATLGATTLRFETAGIAAVAAIRAAQLLRAKGES
jgi:16S rRNA (uracil1498-N3)-methyltransferase